MLCFVLASCSSTPQSGATVAPTSDWDALYRGALTDYVPSAGLRWLVVGSPRYFLVHPALGALRDGWLTKERLLAFSKATGIDLTRTERALMAGFELGTLYMADASGWVTAPDGPFAERLAGSGTVHRPHPRVWRITGLVGSVPQTLVRVDRDLVAVSVGDFTAGRVVELRARGRLARMTKALDGAAMADLPPEFSLPGPLQLFAFGPFEGEWLSDGRGLLAAARAIAASVELDAEGLWLRVVLTGYWDPILDREHLLAIWQALAGSSLGQRLGLDQPSEPVRLSASPTRLSLEAHLALGPVVTGTLALLAGQMDLLPSPAGSEPPARIPH